MVVIRADAFDWLPANVADESVDLVITDPPYGRVTSEDWDQTWTIEAQWEMTTQIERILKPGGTAYCWGGIGTYKNRIFFEWLSMLEELHSVRIYDVITWRKRRAYGCPDRYLFTREECAMLVKGEKPKTFNVPLLEKKRGYAGFNARFPAKSEYLRRTNVWDDVTEIMRGKIHPCAKPIRLAEIMIETSSNPGDLVLDMFAGSGGVGVAAKKLGREYILIERSKCEMYPDV